MKTISNLRLTPDIEAILTAHGEYECFYRRALTADDVKDADIIIGNIDPTLIPYCEKLKLWQLSSAGSDSFAKVAPANVTLCNASGTFGANIAEHLIMFTLMFFRNMPEYHTHQSEHIWLRNKHNRMIDGSVFVILGTGDLGSEFAMRIQALGGYTIGVKRSHVDSLPYFNEVHTMEELDELLPKCDVLAMCLPQNAGTHHVLDERRLALMQPTSVVLNVGRGSAIDETALVQALQEHRIAGAGLDVFEQEPLDENSPLWDMENVIITPHSSGNLSNGLTWNRFYKIVQTNMTNYFEGKELINIVDRKWGY